MEDMAEDTYGKLGIQDSFNVFVSGGFFVLCMFWIYPQLWKFYSSIELQTERYLGGIIICYICGISLQEIGSTLDSKIFKIYDTIIKGCFKKNSDIFNKERLKVYRQYGKKFYI